MTQEEETLVEQLKPFRLVAGFLFGLITLSTIFFHLVEKWDWLDSYYYTIVTIATVGYGDFTPKTDLGKFGATILIMLGIGLFGVFANLLLKKRALRRVKRLKTRNNKS